MTADPPADEEAAVAVDANEQRSFDSKTDHVGLGQRRDDKLDSGNIPVSSQNYVPTTLGRPGAFIRQLKTDLNRLGLNEHTTRADITLYLPRIHGLVVGTALVTSAILFLVMAPLLAQFSLVPLSMVAYTGQFTASVWGILLGVSLFAAIGSAIAWYTYSAPPWLADYVRPIDAARAGTLIGILLLLFPGVIGFYVSIQAGFLILIPTIASISYVTYFELVPHPQFQQIARTAVSIDESLSAADFDLLERHDFTIPHRRATARHLTTDDGIDPDQETVLVLAPNDDVDTFTPGYYRAVASLSNALEDVETVQASPGPLTRGVGAVVAQADPSRLSSLQDRKSAATLADAGAESIDQYAALLTSEYKVDAQRFTDLVEVAQKSISKSGRPNRNELETATACFRDLTRSLGLVVRIEKVRSAWSTRTDLDLDSIIDLPSKPARAGSALLVLEPRVSRAETLAPLATELSEFRSENQQPAAEMLGDTVESYVRRELTALGNGQPDQQVVGSALTVGGKALGLAESHPGIPFGNLVEHLSKRIQLGELSQPEIQEAEDTLDSLTPLATQLSTFRSENEQPAAEVLCDAVETYAQRELTAGENGRLEPQVVGSALTISERALGITDSYPRIPFGNLVEHLSERIQLGELSQSEIQEAKDTLEFADRMLKQVAQLEAETDDKIVASFVGEIRRHVDIHIASPTNPRPSRELLEYTFGISQSVITLDQTHTEYPFNGAIRLLNEKLAEGTLSKEHVTKVETTIDRAKHLLGGLDELNTSHPSVPADEWKNTLRIALRDVSPQRLKNPLEELERLRQLRDEFWDRTDMMTYSPQDFEHVVATLYETKGYDTTVSEYSGDLGVDVWANLDGRTVAIQVKQYSRGNTVGREALQKTVSSIAKGDADQAAVVTSSSFAHTAEDYAEEFGPGLTLVDGEELIQQLSESSVPPPTS